MTCTLSRPASATNDRRLLRAVSADDDDVDQALPHVVEEGVTRSDAMYPSVSPGRWSRSQT